MQPNHLARSQWRLWLCLVALVLISACRLSPPAAGDSSGAEPSADTSVSPGTSTLTDQSPLAVSPTDEPGTGDVLGGLIASEWTLALLVGVGALLFVATGVGVFLLVRGLPRGRVRGASRVAQPPTEPVAEGAPLPEGTLLDEGRYLVLGAADLVNGLHTYEVKSTVALDLCPACFAPAGSDTTTSCPRCGSLLSDPRPSHPLLLARELQDDKSFAEVTHLLDRQLSNRSIVTPVSVFSETSFGAPRYFAIVPDLRSRRAASVEAVQRLDDVLAWGILLAEGLSYLHENAVALISVTAEWVILSEAAARWRCFGNVVLHADETDADLRPAAAGNVKDLARLLVRLATGEEGSRAASSLPEPVARILQQVLRSTGILRAADFGVGLARAREQLHRQQHVDFSIGEHSDVGRLRKLNEDSLLTADLSLSLKALAKSVSVVAVADGVGGHSAGDVASRLAVEALSRETDLLRTQLASGDQVDPKVWVARAGSAANASVLAERQAAGNDMGSTLVMALLIGRSATVLNVGDSRAYWLTPSGMRQVTTDHSLVQRLIAIGQLTPEEARHHPQKSVIYRVLGDKATLAYDLFEVALSSGEALLLCSDGLTDMVEDRVLWHVWREASSPQSACEQLVDLANEAGGYDNVTVVIAQIEG